MQEEEELYAEVMEVDEIDKEIETIINKNKNGK